MENLPTGEISRLVLLPVNPYLLYAYWVVPETQLPTAEAQAVLRLHESARVFDHEVDLAAGSSYIPLWSANKEYQADLGWQARDGSFTPIVQSNIVETPRAWPHAALEGAQASVTSGRLAARQSRSVAARSSADTIGAQDAVLPHHGVEAPLPFELQKTVAELYARRAELPFLQEPIEVDEAIEIEAEASEIVDPEMPYFDFAGIDLTDYAEERFVPGISSARDPLVE